jgi:hypothetical protein
MTKVIIRNEHDLIEFIERKEVTNAFAHELVTKVLKVIVIFHFETKEELIRVSKDYIERWCNSGDPERPIFLQQKGDEFDIRDVFKC